MALTPETARKLGALGITVWYEAGAGLAAGFTDAAYDDAHVSSTRRWAEIDILLCVQAPPATVLEQLRPGASVVGLLAPANDPALAALAADDRLQLFPLQQLPRTTRAQAMDVLSSQAGMAGYKAADCRRTRAALLPDADHRRWHRATGQGAGDRLRRACRPSPPRGASVHTWKVSMCARKPASRSSHWVRASSILA